MLDLFDSPMTTTTSAAKPPTQLELAGLAEAIKTMTRHQGQQAAALRSLFAAHGYDLANGDVLYHAPGAQIDVPPMYASQVRPHKMLEAGAMYFTRNPRFSLF